MENLSAPEPQPAKVLDVTVEYKLPEGKRLFTVNKEKLQQGLAILFPRASRFTLEIGDKGDCYGQSSLLEPNKITLSQREFVSQAVDFFERLTDKSNKTPELIDKAIQRGKKWVNVLLDFAETISSTSPAKYRSELIDERDFSFVKDEMTKPREDQEISETQKKIDVLNLSMQKKIAEILTHETKHKSQIDTGEYMKFVGKTLRYLVPYFSLTAAGIISLELLRSQGLLPPNFPSLSELSSNNFVLFSHFAAVLIPSYIIMLKHARKMEKEAWEAAFAYSDRIIQAININPDFLKKLL